MGDVILDLSTKSIIDGDNQEYLYWDEGGNSITNIDHINHFIDELGITVDPAVITFVTTEPTVPGTETNSHNNLDDLDNDTHSQYHNDSRGDARYYTQTFLDPVITLTATNAANIALRIPTAEKGVSNGVATLTGSTTITPSELTPVSGSVSDNILTKESDGYSLSKTAALPFSAYQENSTQTTYSATSDTFANGGNTRQTLNFTAPETGDYTVFWSWVHRNSNNGRNSGIRITVDGSQIVAGENGTQGFWQVEGKDAGGDIGFPCSGSRRITGLSSGPHSIELIVGIQNDSDTMTVLFTHLEIIRRN